MSTDNRRVIIDSNLLKKAMDKAVEQGFKFSVKALITYLISQFYNEKMDLVVNSKTLKFTGDKETTFCYYPEIMHKVRIKLKDAGLKSTNDFVVNYLLKLYIMED